MAHPFFDVTVYPGTLPEAQALHVALYSSVQVQAEIAKMYSECGTNLMPLNLAMIPADLWLDVLKRLCKLRLLRKLCDNALANPNLVNAHPAIRDVLDYVDPITQPVLSSGVLFVNRDGLRAHLAELAMPATQQSVLIIHGASAGKSWTRYLAVEQAESLGVRYTLLYQDLVGTVGEVVQHLFDQLDPTSQVPPGDETDDAWYRKVCMKLQALAQAKQIVLWIVVDDIGEYPDGPRLTKYIRKFFDQFVIHMASPPFSRWFRLVLVDYPYDTVPTKWNRAVLIEDNLADSEVDIDVLTAFLMKAATHKGKQIAADKARQLGTDVLAKVDKAIAAAAAAAAAASAGAKTPPPRRLQLIHDELTLVYGTL